MALQIQCFTRINRLHSMIYIFSLPIEFFYMSVKNYRNYFSPKHTPQSPVPGGSRFQRCLIILLISLLAMGITGCEKSDPTTNTLGGVVDRQ